MLVVVGLLIYVFNADVAVSIIVFNCCIGAAAATGEADDASSVAPSIDDGDNEIPSTSTSASQRKIELFQTPADDTPVTSSTQDASSYITVRLDQISELVSQVLCKVCGNQTLSLGNNPTRARGLYLKLPIYCGSCEQVVRHFETEQPAQRHQSQPSSYKCVIACRESGIPYDKLLRFWSIMNVRSFMSRSQFTIVSNAVLPGSVKAIDTHLQTVARKVRDQYSLLYGRPIGDDEVLDVAGSFDGTWQKRGRTSHHGVGIFIELETGLVLDFEVLTNHCVECVKHPNPTNVWLTRHKPVCNKNFDGNSGAMEAEAAKRIWKRSISKFNFRYTIMLSDGDSKTYKTLKDLSIYGSDHPISKEECINHVAKRMYNGLISLKETHKSTKKSIHGRGKMTDELMRKFQSYYGQAIRNEAKLARTNNREMDLQRLKQNIDAILLHYTASDANPTHHYCPNTPDTWCKYNKAVLNGDNPPPMPKPKVPENVGKIIQPLFEKLTATSLLDKCRRAATQNTNECFNNLIWSRCPKVHWYGHNSIVIATILATLKFNMGATGVLRVMEAFEQAPVRSSMVQMDIERMRRQAPGAQADKIKRKYAKRQKKKPEDDSYKAGAH